MKQGKSWQNKIPLAFSYFSDRCSSVSRGWLVVIYLQMLRGLLWSAKPSIFKQTKKENYPSALLMTWAEVMSLQSRQRPWGHALIKLTVILPTLHSSVWVRGGGGRGRGQWEGGEAGGGGGWGMNSIQNLLLIHVLFGRERQGSVDTNPPGPDFWGELPWWTMQFSFLSHTTNNPGWGARLTIVNAHFLPEL